MKGGREAQLGSDSGLNTQSGLNCTGHVPSPRGPGYHRVYGETTKHASDASARRKTLDGRVGPREHVECPIRPGYSFWAGGHVKTCPATG
jgi:hypothetical protein